MDQLLENRNSSLVKVRGMSSDGKGGDYDYTGAMYFTVAVVMVYGLSIVALIATHMRGRDGETKEESKQVSHYIQNQASIKRRGENEQLLWLQRELIGVECKKPTSSQRPWVSGKSDPQAHPTTLRKDGSKSGYDNLTPAPFCSDTYHIPTNAAENRHWIRETRALGKSKPTVIKVQSVNSTNKFRTESQSIDIAPSRKQNEEEYCEDIATKSMHYVNGHSDHSGKTVDAKRPGVQGLRNSSLISERPLLGPRNAKKEPKSPQCPTGGPENCAELITEDVWQRRTETV